MAKTFIICEKPSAAAKIAAALAEKKPAKKELNGAPYYEFERDDKQIIVSSALGHLFTLKNLRPMKEYPVYDVGWMPTYKVDKKAARTKPFVEAIQELSKGADEFISATDYDTEGAVIGYNVLKFLCGEDSIKRAKRMKFSALTTQDLLRAYDNPLPKLDFELVDSGIARHVLDWYWGMNVSKAMSAAVESAHQRFAKLSAGRVQTPTLRILVEREREIKAFKPEPFWVIGLLFEFDGQEIVAEHATPRFFDKREAEKVRDACKSKKARVSAIQTRRYQQHPPIPFDLGTLQAEAYRCFGYTPMRTQQIAQQLYDAAYISYPRTSNQKFPPTIDLAAILKHLRGNSRYKKLVDSLLKQKKLSPTEGSRTDPAHPPIHPTGEKPARLSGPQQNIYDLIVRRFLSIFGRPAVKESIKVELDVNGQRFYLRGRNILDEGWLEYYAPFIYRDEVALPKLVEGQELVPKELRFEEKETQPPPRYNPASIIKVMEEKNLGTKCLCGNVPVLTSNFQTFSVQELYENSCSWNKHMIPLVPLRHGLKKCKKIDPRRRSGRVGGSLNSLNITFGALSLLENCLRANAVSFKSVSQMSTGPSNVTCLAFNPATLEVVKKSAVPSRRETEPWEEILSIRTKYGSIGVTSDHPIFVTQNGKITCKKAAEIKAGDKLLAYIPRNQLEGREIKLKKTTFIYGVSEKLGKEVAAKRKALGLSQDEFAKLFGVSRTTIHAHENGSRVPISALTKLDITPQFVGGRSTSEVIPNPFPIHTSSQLARLVGRLTGDGSFGMAKFKNENSCDFRYHNTEPSMIQSLLQDMMAIFKVRPKVASTDKGRKRRIYWTKLPGVAGRILLDIAPEIVVHEVPKIVLNDKRFWPDYLSALFDDEATVPTGELKLRFTQKSKKLISQITSMLNELGIRTWPPRFENGSWKFGIYGRRSVERFLLRVGLTHPAKLQRLLTSVKRRPVIQKKAMVYYLLSRGLMPAEIARELKCSIALIRGYLRELLLDGLIGRSRKFLGRGRGSTSKYFSKAPFAATFYALLDAEIITYQLCCKPVHAIERVEKPRFVYDLSVDRESPAFVAGADNIIVHNSTRAPTVQTLYERGYIFGNQITVTDIGMEVVDSLSKHCPEIVSEELTAHFESEMEKIQEGKTSKDNVIAEAREKLDEMLGKFKEKQDDIGKDLGDAYAETKRKQRVLGTCAKCGGDLRVIVSRATHKRFAGCSNYPNCKNAFPLPQAGFIVSLGKACERCGAPMIQVNRAGMRPYRMCLEPKCESKRGWGKRKAAAAKYEGEESS